MNTTEIKQDLEELLQFVDNEIHPVVSYEVYGELYDKITLLAEKYDAIILVDLKK